MPAVKEKQPSLTEWAGLDTLHNNPSPFHQPEVQKKPTQQPVKSNPLEVDPSLFKVVPAHKVQQPKYAGTDPSWKGVSAGISNDYQHSPQPSPTKMQWAKPAAFPTSKQEVVAPAAAVPAVLPSADIQKRLASKKASELAPYDPSWEGISAQLEGEWQQPPDTVADDVDVSSVKLADEVVSPPTETEWVPVPSTYRPRTKASKKSGHKDTKESLVPQKWSGVSNELQSTYNIRPDPTPPTRRALQETEKERNSGDSVEEATGDSYVSMHTHSKPESNAPTGIASFFDFSPLSSGVA